MALVLKNRVLETCTAPGTGAVTLLGAVTGYQTFSSAIGNANTCYYTIADQNGANWEVGIGTYTSSGNTLTRTTVLSSSNGGATTNFTSGTQNVFVTYPSERSVNLSSSALTSGRVTYATTDGLLTDSANLTFNGTTLTAAGFSGPINGVVTSSSITDSGLTSGRVTYATTGGLLTDSANLTFNGTSLSVGGNGSFNVGASGSVSTGNSTYSGYFSAVGGGSGATWSLTPDTISGANGVIYNTSFVSGGSGPHIFSVGGSEKMRITSAGDVGIGVTPNTTNVGGTYKLLSVGTSGGSGIFMGQSDSTASGSAIAQFFGKTTGTAGYQLAGGMIVALDGTSTTNAVGRLQFYTASGGSVTEAMRLDSSGNLGLGVTPSAWSGAKAYQVYNASMYSTGGNTFLANNYYYNGSNNIYIQNNYASALGLNNGQFQFYTAPSGTAGNAISFTQAMTLDNSGNLCVGTTTALNAAANRGNITVNGSSSAVISIGVGGVNKGYIYSQGTDIIANADTGAFTVQTASAQPVIFGTNSSERMRIDSSGNVGIGTTSPSTYNKLTVLNGAITSGTAPSTNGSILLQGYYNSGSITNIGTEYSNGGPVIGYAVTPSTSASGSFVSSTPVNTSKGAYTISGNTHLWYGGAASTTAIGSAVTTSELMRIDSSGKLNIGCTSGNSILNLQSSGTVGIQFNPNGSTANTGYIQNDGTYLALNSSQGSTGIKFRMALAAPDYCATIDSSGNVLVGTTAQYANTGHIVTNNSTATYGLVIRDTGATTGGISFLNNSGTGVGSVTIGSATTSYNVTSDQRLKENIVDAPQGNIDQIKVRSFDWKANGSHQEYGMVAQELLEVAPYAVHQPQNPEEMMAVDYSKLVPMMIKEIQDLKQRIATLENK